jgi:cobalt-zinc-cadmium efflux system protein
MEHIQSSTSEHRKALLVVLGLTVIYLAAEVMGGILTNSLALLADAAHMLTDASGIVLALFATWIASRPATPSTTYGYYRVEILAAVLNALILLGSVLFILYEAGRRLQQPPEVTSGAMLLVAVIGFVINLISFRILHEKAEDSLNIQGAMLEVLGDV